MGVERNFLLQQVSLVDVLGVKRDSLFRSKRRFALLLFVRCVRRRVRCELEFCPAGLKLGRRRGEVGPRSKEEGRKNAFLDSVF